MQGNYRLSSRKLDQIIRRHRGCGRSKAMVFKEDPNLFVQ